MSIKLMSGGYPAMYTPDWDAIQKIARELGWVPMYDEPPTRAGWGSTKWKLTESNTRALAQALHKAIRAMEEDCLSDPLVGLVRRVHLSNLRDFADFLFFGALHAEEQLECEEGVI